MSATQIKNGFHGGSDDQLLVNPDGSINVNTSGSGPSNVNASLDGLNSFQTSQATIGVTAIQLANPALTNRSSISLRVDKNNTGTIYIGNSNAVTLSTGYPLFAGDTLGMDLTPSSQVWAVSDIAGQVIAVLEIA